MEKTAKAEKIVGMFQNLITNLHYSRAKAIKVIHRETGLELATVAFIVSVFCSGVGIDN